MIRKPKWIFSRHTRDLNTLIYVAEYLKINQVIEDNERKKLLKDLRNKGIYKKRFDKSNLSTLMNKISDLNFYMFGYKEKIDKKLKFLFSPLGNLFLKNVDNSEKRSKIFCSMLWGVQFSHPHNRTDENFDLYPFRLIFNLLLDKRLENKLFVDEVARIVVFTKIMRTEKQYESLVNKILKFRKLRKEEIKDIFLADKTDALVNAVYEWDYYVSKILRDMGIFEYHEGELITDLKQGKSKTTRKLRNSHVKLNKNLESFIKKLNKEASVFDAPIDFKSETKLTSNIKKEIYNFCPITLLEEIGEVSFDYEILKLPERINKFAENPGGKGYDRFEEILEESFNIFYNVNAKRISGSGNTDIECIYTEEPKKFAVEAKSTKNKLLSLNAGRVTEHLRIIGGKYTIVITPRYVPAVLKDIKGSKVVILLASTFSEFLYNNLISKNRKIDFGLFDKIIEEKLGSDISSEISKVTLKNFASSK